MNKQRQAVYGMRRALLEGQDQKERDRRNHRRAFWARFIDLALPRKELIASQWDWTGLETDILTQFGVKIRTDELKNLDRRQVEEDINEQLVKKYQEKEAMVGAGIDARNRAHDHAERHR